MFCIYCRMYLFHIYSFYACTGCTYMQYLQLLSAINKQIDKPIRILSLKIFDDIRDFLTMVPWDKSFRPKKIDVCGLLRKEAINRIFLSKLTWKLFQDRSLWVSKWWQNSLFMKTFQHKAKSETLKCNTNMLDILSNQINNYT